jgi:hypothetical protein
MLGISRIPAAIIGENPGKGNRAMRTGGMRI